MKFAQVNKNNTDQADGQVNLFNINTLDELVAFTNQANDQAKRILEDAVYDKVMPMLNLLDYPLRRTEIFEKLGLRNHSDTRKRYIDPMVHYGWIEMTIPESPTHPNQRYEITESGRRLLRLLKRTAND